MVTAQDYRPVCMGPPYMTTHPPGSCQASVLLQSSYSLLAALFAELLLVADDLVTRLIV